MRPKHHSGFVGKRAGHSAVRSPTYHILQFFIISMLGMFWIQLKNTQTEQFQLLASDLVS
jgi:hypothetical protein